MEPALVKPFNLQNFNKIFLGVLIASVILGTGVGLILASKKPGDLNTLSNLEQPKDPEQDTKTFRDFTEGTIKKRPESKDPEEYVEGTHLLIREGAVPVALTSSVVELGQYEGKRVKVYGETQKAVKEGWLMDVGKVEVKN